jgi:hypothetical protein
MSNPWDVLPPPANGDQSDDNTFAAVGRAFSSWEYFEGNLSLLFANLVGRTEQETTAAIRSYGSVMAFTGRSRMVTAAAEVHFVFYPSVDAPDKLRELLNLANCLSARRNEIAYGIVQPYVPRPLAPVGYTERRYALFPAYYATNKRKFEDKPEYGFISTPKYIYASAEIGIYERQFTALADPTIELTQSVLVQKRT